MAFNLTEVEFLSVAGLSKDELDRSGVAWELLEGIARDYDSVCKKLEISAELIASHLRTIEGVHSVRWRVKDVVHLLKKVVRKNLEDKPAKKWKGITVNNYLSVATDLIGVRALHLFKDDCVKIDEAIRDHWPLREKVKIYMRSGDVPNQELIRNGASCTNHNYGYRSVHYIVGTRPGRNTFYAEIQVRTIFQEGWSEIDHRVRYPDYSDNELVKLFLSVFNRLAGSADDMGSFIQTLVGQLNEYESKSLEVAKDRDEAFVRMHDLVSQLEELKDKDEQSQGIISGMKEQLARFKVSEYQKNPLHSMGGFTAGEYNELSHEEFVRAVNRMKGMGSGMVENNLLLQMISGGRNKEDQ